MNEITTTYQIILDSIPALQHLAGMEIKAAASLKLARLIKAVDAEIKLFWEKHAELAVKCGGVLSEDNSSYTIPPEGQDTFAAEFTDMLASEVTLTVARLPIVILEGVSLSPLEMMKLETYFKD